MRRSPSRGPKLARVREGEADARTWPTAEGDYEKQAEAGVGASSQVWRALCKPLGEVVALKTVELEKMNRDLDEIFKETHAMSLANHPNVLKLHTSFVHKDALWMVMPFMSGGSIHSILKWAHPDGLEEPVIARIAKEVLKGLEYLHKNGNIHRDVKAGNILLDGSGGVKLGDLGVAADMDRTGSWGKEGTHRQTFVGTPCWMAPEVMEQSHRGYDWHADIWSFGITLLELAHGHAPFAKLPPMKVLLMTLTEEPPTLEENYKQRHFSKAMREVVSLCLQKDPEKRPKAAKLLEHRFFKAVSSDPDFLAKRLLRDLPPLCERIAALKTDRGDGRHPALDRRNEEQSDGQYIRGVSGWHFDVTHDSFVPPGGPASASASPPRPPRPEPGSAASSPGRSIPVGRAAMAKPLPHPMRKQPSMTGRFAVYDEDDSFSGSSDDEAGGGVAQKPSPQEPPSARTLPHTPSAPDSGASTPKDVGSLADMNPPLGGGFGTGRKDTARKSTSRSVGRFVVEEEDTERAASPGAQWRGPRSGSGTPNSKVELLVPQLQSALYQAHQQQDFLQTILGALTSEELDVGHAQAELTEHAAKELARQGSAQRIAEVTVERSDRAPTAEREERERKAADASKPARRAPEHACVTAAVQLEAKVRGLVEENEALKAKNLKLERELNKLYNLRLEEEEDRQKHAEEALEDREERLATARVEAIEKEHKLESSRKSQLNLLGGQEGEPGAAGPGSK